VWCVCYVEICAFLVLAIVGSLFAIAQFVIAVIGAVQTDRVHCPDNLDFYMYYIYCREVNITDSHIP